MNPKNILKYVILGLFVLNLPTVALKSFGSVAGTILSYGSFFLLICYYLFFLKGKPHVGILICGVLYFAFGAFQLMGEERDFFTNFAKFFIVVFFGSSFFSEITRKEVRIVLAIGAISIILNSVYFDNFNGRAAGFYFNPNGAGFVALFGYAISNNMKAGKYKIAMQIIFSLAGFLTFSRTFLVIWALINVISIRSNPKNIRILVAGVVVFLALLVVGSAFDIGGKRFDKYKGVLSDETTTEDLGHDSRDETWALFYDAIFEKPIFGYGYGSFQGGGIKGIGAHNTYLLIIGESGIIPLLFFVGLLIILLIKSWRLFYIEPSLFLLCLALTIYLLTTHNFYDNEVKLALSLFLFNKIYQVEELNTISSKESYQIKSEKG
ncbi:MAG: hypothetical protein Mars2KO_10070 [Maribacter sp.]